MAKRPKQPSPPSAENADLDFEAPDFTEFFGDGSEPVTVELYRDLPRFVGDQKVHGFCETLSLGTSLQTIKEAYGGGKFRVVQRDAGGKVQKQRHFDIAGNPVLSAPVPTQTASATPVGATVPVARTEAIQVDGIPLSGDLSHDLQLVKSAMVLRSLLQQPNSNDRLVELLLAQQQRTDPLSSLKDLAPLISTFRELAAELQPAQSGDGGAGLGDLLKTGLQAFVEYMKTMRAVKPTAQAAVTEPVKATVALPDSPARVELARVEKQYLEPPVEAPAESETAMQFNPQAIIAQAIQAICQSFRLGKPVERVVVMLNGAIPLTAEMKQNYLGGRRDQLFDQAELVMDADDDSYSEALERRAAFKTYFEQVFDGFLNS